MKLPTRAELSAFLARHGWWLCVLLVLGYWYARPLWVARVLPLHDLPNSLAQITALHYLDDPAWNLQPYYERSMGLVPYLGHFYVVHLMAFIFKSVTRANLIYMTIYVIAAPLCGLVFARATGRSRWLAFLLLPLAVCYFFQWGFISFCVGAMLLLVASGLLFRLHDAPSWQRALGVGLMAIALYLCHVLPWGAFGIYGGLLCVIELARRRWRGAIYGVLAMLPSLGCFFIGLLHARSTGFIAGGRYDAQASSPAAVLAHLPNIFNLFRTQSVDEWVQLGLIAVLLLLLASDDGPTPDEPWIRRVRIPLGVVLFLVLAGVVPFWVKRPFNWWMINLRFLMFAAAFAVFLPRGRILGLRAGLLAFGLGCSTLLPFYMAKNYQNYSYRVEPIIRLIGETPYGSNTLLLHTPHPTGLHRTFDDPVLSPEITFWRELYNYPLVYRGGYDPYLYSNNFPVKAKKTLPAPRIESAMVKIYSNAETKFDPERMLYGWDYFIVRDDYLNAMPPDGVVKMSTDHNYVLFRNLLKDSVPDPGELSRKLTADGAPLQRTDLPEEGRLPIKPTEREP